MGITKNEINLALEIFSNPENRYNSNSLSKKLGISAMGSFKIIKKLEKENIIKGEKFGKAVFYEIDLDNDYARQYIKLLLKRKSEQTSNYIKRWIAEIRKIKNAELSILFGSVIIKENQAKDIDILFVTSQKNYLDLKKEIEEINIINIKKIHPIFQSKKDLEENIKKRDKVILNAIKGIVVFGEDVLIDILK